MHPASVAVLQLAGACNQVSPFPFLPNLALAVDVHAGEVLGMGKSEKAQASTQKANATLVKEKKTMVATFSADYAAISANTTAKDEFVAEIQKTILGNLLKKFYDVYARQDTAACQLTVIIATASEHHQQHQLMPCPSTYLLFTR